MVEIPAAHKPKGPPERRDCKPKRKSSPLTMERSIEQTVVENIIVDGAAIERISVQLTCFFDEPPPLFEETPLEETTAQAQKRPAVEEALFEELDEELVEEPRAKKAKLAHEPETRVETEALAKESPSETAKLLGHETETEIKTPVEEETPALHPAFHDIWGSSLQPTSPNSRRNKDMLWSLTW